MSRRLALRVGAAGCTCAVFAPLFAQTLAPTAAAGRADPWKRAQSHVQQALSMAASVRSSLDGLTSAVAQALEKLEKFKKQEAQLTAELARLRERKESMLEEYRQGLFCSGCGQTRSQILAKGERFPHPGQTIVRPTPQQIAAKERELQAPIDTAERQRTDAQRNIREQDDLSIRGLEQIRLGVRFWRASSSRAELAHMAGAGAARQELEAQKKLIEERLATARRAAAAARDETAAEQAQAELATWQRLQQKNAQDLQALTREIVEVQNRVSRSVSQDRQRIQDYVTRGALFARTGGPPEPLLFPALSDGDLGMSYQMGKIPRQANEPPLAQVRRFIGDYRAFGVEFKIGSLGALGPAAPAAPAPATRPAPPAAAGAGLLGPLP